MDYTRVIFNNNNNICWSVSQKKKLRLTFTKNIVFFLLSERTAPEQYILLLLLYIQLLYNPYFEIYNIYIKL